MRQVDVKPSEKQCHISQNMFYLKKINTSSDISVQLDFSPQHQQPTCDGSPTKNIAIFNRDSKYYTPSFILSIDKNRYIENQQIYAQIHNRKTLESQQQKVNLFVPKPSKNNSYCCICKMPFEDYLTHINIPAHQTLMKNSEYYNKIFDICNIYQAKSQPVPLPPKKRGRPKTKKIAKLVLCKSMSKETSDQSNRAEEMAIQQA